MPRPPLAMKFWLFRRWSGNSETAAGSSGHTSGMAHGIESLEHMVRNRVRLFLRHSWLVTILGTVAIAAAVGAGFYYTQQAGELRIAVPPADARFVDALAAQIDKTRQNLHLRAVRTLGPQASAEAMTKGQADLAILPSTADPSFAWPVIAILRQNVMTLIVPAPAAGAAKAANNAKPGKSAKPAKAAHGAKSEDSDDAAGDSGGGDKFGKVSDLAGKRVGIVTGNAANAGLLQVVLAHYGVPRDKVTMSEIDPANVADAVKNNQVDILFVAGAATGRAISSAIAAATRNGKAPGFIAVDQADGIAERNPAFGSLDIDAGTFGGTPPTPDDSLKSLSFADYLVARKSVGESTIASLSGVLYASRRALADAMPGEIKIAAPSTDKDAKIVVHPGTLAYLADSQKSFFDKYGDEIFYGMLIFPLFGSAIAAIASYLRRDTRTRRLRLLQRVLDLVRKAHAAQDLETIERLQVDADNLVIAIVHQGEHEEFDETVRMSFAFALDQLRFAIAARRHAILDRGGAAAGARIAVA